ncbi:MAG: Glycosyl transferase, group 2 family [Rhodanobacteraceae bacterium]|nr:MAG: Glycosyl transferase, group 2 family [Rhodanobacteraceae bacterium]
MVNNGSGDKAGKRWRVVGAPRARAVWAEPIANEQLRRLSASNGEALWKIAGARPGFVLDQRVLGRTLAAGWYEWRGRLEAEEGRIVLPSVRLHYAVHSALSDVEVMLPEPDEAGRFGTLLLFLEDVESLEFVPGTSPAVFRVRDVSLCRVSRLAALRMLLGGAFGEGQPWRVRRLLTWIRAVRQRGLKRATDDLYADYRKRNWPLGISEYEAWVRKYDTIDQAALEALNRRAQALDDRGPLISVLLIVRGASELRLRRCLDGVLGQVWEKWDLRVAGCTPRLAPVLDEYAARDPRIRVGHGGSGVEGCNAALAAANGEFVLLLQDDCELRPHALLRMAEAVAADQELAVVYSDEDRIGDDDKRFDPGFKPDWNPDLLRSEDFMGRVVAIRTTWLREVGGFRAGFEGSEGYDLVLRCSERAASKNIRHIPKILYHVRASREDPAAGTGATLRASAELSAVARHLERMGDAATVEAFGHAPGLRRVRWKLPTPAPRVGLIIPTRDRVGLLRACVESILTKTTYPDFELVVVDNRSSDRAALDYLRELAAREHVRVLRYDAPFNYAAINNWAVRQCNGMLLGLVNNDIEVISPDWLEEMAGFALRPDTGAVGAMLYYPDDTIQHAGMLLGIHGVAGHAYAGKPRGYRGYMARALVAQNLSVVTGACLLVRREVFEAVGGLDERFPVEFNDVDFCLRLLERGYRNVWTPFAELYHHESATRVIDGAPARQARFNEAALMLERWAAVLRDDPAYNPNLSLQSLDAGLAFPPRRDSGRHRGIGYDGG